MRNEMRLPHHALLLRILVPVETVGHPAGSYDVWSAVVVHVCNPLSAVRHKLAHDFDGSILMDLPLASLRSGILVPERPAEEIGPAISIHIHAAYAFGVVCAQQMDEVLCFRLPVRAVAALLIQLSTGEKGSSEAGGCNSKFGGHVFSRS